jgi:hypothetical protein
MSYKVEFRIYGEREWASNALRFATAEEAGHYWADLFRRWFALEGWRIAECDEPVNYALRDDQPVALA